MPTRLAGGGVIHTRQRLHPADTSVGHGARLRLGSFAAAGALPECWPFLPRDSPAAADWYHDANHEGGQSGPASPKAIYKCEVPFPSWFLRIECDPLRQKW